VAEAERVAVEAECLQRLKRVADSSVSDGDAHQNVGPGRQRIGLKQQAVFDSYKDLGGRNVSRHHSADLRVDRDSTVGVHIRIRTRPSVQPDITNAVDDFAFVAKRFGDCSLYPVVRNRALDAR
jgi:hypothetical protein